MYNLTYSFIRSEIDNTITLFIKGDRTWLLGEIDFILNKDQQLQVTVGENLFISGLLPAILYSSLSLKHTKVIVCDWNANFLAQTILEPLG